MKSSSSYILSINYYIKTLDANLPEGDVKTFIKADLTYSYVLV